MVLDNFKGDGSTRAFTTGTRESFALDSTGPIICNCKWCTNDSIRNKSTANTITVTFISTTRVRYRLQDLIHWKSLQKYTKQYNLMVQQQDTLLHIRLELMVHMQDCQ